MKFANKLLSKRFLSAFALTAILMVTSFGLYSKFDNKTPVDAASSTFWLVPTPSTGLPTSLALMLDADAEGSSLLGAEAHISYDTSKVTVNSVAFGTCPFDSCINLSEVGTVKLMAVSGVPENGGVSGQHTFATINVSMSAATTFTFTKCQVIDNLQVLKSCTSTSLVINPGATCGNNVIEGIEDCDDGNTMSGDGCSDICEIETTCGDGAVEGDEECDDGNLADGDGCSSACTVEPVCGNGSVEGVEECDDGNLDDGDGCSSACTVEAV
jgi:cysteine-rich repeat protein